MKLVVKASMILTEYIYRSVWSNTSHSFSNVGTINLIRRPRRKEQGRANAQMLAWTSRVHVPNVENLKTDSLL